jgi:hypothetical protein
MTDIAIAAKKPTGAAAAVRIQAKGVGTIRLPWWPEEIRQDRLAPVWETQDRPGREPVLLRRGLSIPEVRIGGIVGTRDGGLTGNVGPLLAKLEKAANVSTPVILRIATRSGRYRITDLSITELDWANNGQPREAEVSIVLTGASNASIPVGPVKKR